MEGSHVLGKIPLQRVRRSAALAFRGTCNTIKRAIHSIKRALYFRKGALYSSANRASRSMSARIKKSLVFRKRVLSSLQKSPVFLTVCASRCLLEEQKSHRFYEKSTEFYHRSLVFLQKKPVSRKRALYFLI